MPAITPDNSNKRVHKFPPISQAKLHPTPWQKVGWGKLKRIVVEVKPKEEGNEVHFRVQTRNLGQRMLSFLASLFQRHEAKEDIVKQGFQNTVDDRTFTNISQQSLDQLTVDNFDRWAAEKEVLATVLKDISLLEKELKSSIQAKGEELSKKAAILSKEKTKEPPVSQPPVSEPPAEPKSPEPVVVSAIVSEPEPIALPDEQKDLPKEDTPDIVEEPSLPDAMPIPEVPVMESPPLAPVSENGEVAKRLKELTLQLAEIREGIRDKMVSKESEPQNPHMELIIPPPSHAIEHGIIDQLRSRINQILNEIQEDERNIAADNATKKIFLRNVEKIKQTVQAHLETLNSLDREIYANYSPNQMEKVSKEIGPALNGLENGYHQLRQGIANVESLRKELQKMEPYIRQFSPEIQKNWEVAATLGDDSLQISEHVAKLEQFIDNIYKSSKAENAAIITAALVKLNKLKTLPQTYIDTNKEKGISQLREHLLKQRQAEWQHLKNVNDGLVNDKFMHTAQCRQLLIEADAIDDRLLVATDIAEYDGIWTRLTYIRGRPEPKLWQQVRAYDMAVAGYIKEAVVYLWDVLPGLNLSGKLDEFLQDLILRRSLTVGEFSQLSKMMGKDVPPEIWTTVKVIEILLKAADDNRTAVLQQLNNVEFQKLKDISQHSTMSKETDRQLKMLQLILEENRDLASLDAVFGKWNDLYQEVSTNTYNRLFEIAGIQKGFGDLSSQIKEKLKILTGQEKTDAERIVNEIEQEITKITSVPASLREKLDQLVKRFNDILTKETKKENLRTTLKTEINGYNEQLNGYLRQISQLETQCSSEGLAFNFVYTFKDPSTGKNENRALKEHVPILTKQALALVEKGLLSPTITGFRYWMPSKLVSAPAPKNIDVASLTIEDLTRYHNLLRLNLSDHLNQFKALKIDDVSSSQREYEQLKKQINNRIEQLGETDIQYVLAKRMKQKLDNILDDRKSKLKNNMNLQEYHNKLKTDVIALKNLLKEFATVQKMELFKQYEEFEGNSEIQAKLRNIFFNEASSRITQHLEYCQSNLDKFNEHPILLAEANDSLTRTKAALELHQNKTKTINTSREMQAYKEEITRLLNINDNYIAQLEASRTKVDEAGNRLKQQLAAIKMQVNYLRSAEQFIAAHELEALAAKIDNDYTTRFKEIQKPVEQEAPKKWWSFGKSAITTKEGKIQESYLSFSDKVGGWIGTLLAKVDESRKQNLTIVDQLEKLDSYENKPTLKKELLDCYKKKVAEIVRPSIESLTQLENSLKGELAVYMGKGKGAEYSKELLDDITSKKNSLENYKKQHTHTIPGIIFSSNQVILIDNLTPKQFKTHYAEVIKNARNYVEGLSEKPSLDASSFHAKKLASTLEEAHKKIESLKKEKQRWPAYELQERLKEFEKTKETELHGYVKSENSLKQLPNQLISHHNTLIAQLDAFKAPLFNSLTPEKQLRAFITEKTKFVNLKNKLAWITNRAKIGEYDAIIKKFDEEIESLRKEIIENIKAKINGYTKKVDEMQQNIETVKDAFKFSDVINFKKEIQTALDKKDEMQQFLISPSNSKWRRFLGARFGGPLASLTAEELLDGRWNNKTAEAYIDDLVKAGLNSISSKYPFASLFEEHTKFRKAIDESKVQAEKWGREKQLYYAALLNQQINTSMTEVYRHKPIDNKAKMDAAITSLKNETNLLRNEYLNPRKVRPKLDMGAQLSLLKGMGRISEVAPYMINAIRTKIGEQQLNLVQCRTIVHGLDAIKLSPKLKEFFINAVGEFEKNVQEYAIGVRQNKGVLRLDMMDISQLESHSGRVDQLSQSILSLKQQLNQLEKASKRYQKVLVESRDYVQVISDEFRTEDSKKLSLILDNIENNLQGFYEATATYNENQAKEDPAPSLETLVIESIVALEGFLVRTSADVSSEYAKVKGIKQKTFEEVFKNANENQKVGLANRAILQLSDILSQARNEINKVRHNWSEIQNVFKELSELYGQNIIYEVNPELITEMDRRLDQVSSEIENLRNQVNAPSGNTPEEKEKYYSELIKLEKNITTNYSAKSFEEHLNKITQINYLYEWINKFSEQAGAIHTSIENYGDNTGYLNSILHVQTTIFLRAFSRLSSPDQISENYIFSQGNHILYLGLESIEYDIRPVVTDAWTRLYIAKHAYEIEKCKADLKDGEEIHQEERVQAVRGVEKLKPIHFRGFLGNLTNILKWCIYIKNGIERKRGRIAIEPPKEEKAPRREEDEKGNAAALRREAAQGRAAAAAAGNEPRVAFVFDEKGNATPIRGEALPASPESAAAAAAQAQTPAIKKKKKKKVSGAQAPAPSPGPGPAAPSAAAAAAAAPTPSPSQDIPGPNAGAGARTEHAARYSTKPRDYAASAYGTKPREVTPGPAAPAAAAAPAPSPAPSPAAAAAAPSPSPSPAPSPSPGPAAAAAAAPAASRAASPVDDGRGLGNMGLGGLEGQPPQNVDYRSLNTEGEKIDYLYKLILKSIDRFNPLLQSSGAWIRRDGSKGDYDKIATFEDMLQYREDLETDFNMCRQEVAQILKELSWDIYMPEVRWH